MSRVVKIKGNTLVTNIEVAEKTIKEIGMKGVIVSNGTFLFEGYDYNDGRYKSEELKKIEELYVKNLQQFEEELAVKLKELEEQRKFEELKRLEEDRLRVEKERIRVQNITLDKIKANAKKNGYKIKRELTEDNKVKLILVKRVY